MCTDGARNASAADTGARLVTTTTTATAGTTIATATATAAAATVAATVLAVAAASIPIVYVNKLPSKPGEDEARCEVFGAPPKSLGRCGSGIFFLPSITLGCKNLKHTTQGHSKHG